MSPQSPIFGNSISDDEVDAAKAVFLVCISLVTMIWCIASYFIVLIKGWGLEVQSWGWMFFLWFLLTVVSIIKDKAIKFIKDLD